MPTAVVFAAYGVSVLAAALLLFFFHEKAWYVHLLAIAAAIGVGLIRLPDALHGPVPDLIVGAVFMFLFIWGVGGPILQFLRPHWKNHHV